jgi:hypothetical protein
MSDPKQQPKPESEATKAAPKRGGALSDAALNKVTGGNMPTSVERSKGGTGQG